jgi:hypothetical protein
MSTFFEGSVVVTQNGPGHSHLAVKSACTKGHIIAYLESGKLPTDGTVCEPDWQPLIDVPSL